MELHESAEDYLETILKIKDTRGAVRSIDVATELGFSKPSVSVAMKKLRETGYITVDPDGSIELTQQGHTAAANVYERHKCLTAFLMSIGVSEQNAKTDACKIEHDLSAESFECIKAFFEKQEM
ncbi:MAG: metal-dependent transcriptional regulator [Clostridia bacterium]|jgi:DtxR family transcriptional regulator, Mn-dependent transcriptional regulator|nr:metal-dependent transcriptional regulator [Clostridia bacterium]NLS85221.1 metal-dependent transcriptional regulator [Oscillospiraceae bacterium]